LSSAAFAAELQPTNEIRAVATIYSRSLAGRPMKNGRRFNPKDPTIAASSLANYGRKAVITNPQNGRSIRVSFEDRMGRDDNGRLDLPPAALEPLGLNKDKGVYPVTISFLDTD
jgi:rare lipoprotein A (peptidoglycan hydrolase)